MALKQKIYEYSKLANDPNKFIGKFPVEIYRKWYEQYDHI